MKITDLLLTAGAAYNEVVEIVGTLTLDPNKSITITTNSNIIVTGKLVSRPIWPAVHTIRFTGIDESKFQGGGESVLPSDVGLWVMGNGQLDISGEAKTAWTNSIAGLKRGDTKIPVNESNNWKTGDELVISRTAKGATDDDVVKILSIANNVITTDKPLLYDHPVLTHPETGDLCWPEVINLTRNIRIEGTQKGMSHIFIMSMMMQNIMYCQVRYMGPRKNTSGGTEKEPVKGRYGIHFHHCMDSNVGMCMEGNVARNCNNHAFVTHMSNGICWCYNIVYDALETGFWSDIGDATHGIEYDHNIVGKISYVPGSMTLEDATTPSFGAGGFILGMGDGNSCHDNVCFGIISQLGIDGVGVYQWRNNNESTWFFKNNIAHNCSSALDIWQNTAENHTLEGLIAYYCTSGGRLGAYSNVYRYVNCIFYESPLLVRHGSLTSLRARFEGLTIINGGPGYGDYEGINAGIIQSGSPVDTIGELKSPPVLYRNCKLINCDFVLAGGEKAHWADFVDCTFRNLIVKGSEVARVQQSGKAYQQTSSGKKDIPLFAPTMWGTGNGVLVEYFSDTNFKNKVAELIQPQANFTEWQNLGGPHHNCPGSKYSVRVTGQWQPQYTDSYTFDYSMDAGGSIEQRIDGVLINIVSPKPLPLIAGKKYNLELKFRSTGSQVAGFSFNCYCASMAVWHKSGETVPQSQLYTPGIITPPVNQAPQANAGPDQTITLPINSTVLNGSGSDSDGIVKSYLWSKETGPAQFGIATPAQPSTQITGLVEGVYSFGLSVTDDKGTVTTDYVTITVKPAVVIPNQPPVVSATATAQVIKTGTIFLNGGGTDPEGKPVTFQWTQVSGNAVSIINATGKDASVQNAPAGTYKFSLTVTDDKGAKSSVDVPVTI